MTTTPYCCGHRMTQERQDFYYASYVMVRPFGPPNTTAGSMTVHTLSTQILDMEGD